MSEPAYTRIYPPDDMRRPGIRFSRAEDVEELIRCEFTGRGGLFFDAEHFHLNQATIGVLWASSRHVVRGSVKAGTAQLVKTGEPTKWSEAVQRAFLIQHFGSNLPTFRITLSAPICSSYTDREFFALIDHELSHCDVLRAYGAPKFNDRTGLPVWSMRPHDHEGFVGTTARWGAVATGAAGIVEAGSRKPRFHWVPGRDLDVRAACAL